MPKTPSPQQWQVIERLAASGCPLDLIHLPPPNRPVRVINTPSELRTNVFASDVGVALVLVLRIVASEPITICGLRIEAGWLKAPLRAVTTCDRHQRKSCIPINGTHLSFESAKLLNRFGFTSAALKRHESLAGLFVAISDGLLPTEANLRAVLWVQDILGSEYPYSLNLVCQPLGV